MDYASKVQTLRAMRPEGAIDPWRQIARELLKKEMACSRPRVRFKELAIRLERYGIEMTPDQINRKINRGTFSAAFLLACLAALDQKVELKAWPVGPVKP